MSERVTPRVDIAFKKLFGVEENKDLLISLINSIVSKEDQIVDVELLNPYNPQNFQKDKLSILDIKAKGHTGKRYNIEMQISDVADYDKRALFYWARLYTEQLSQNEKYSNLNKTIGIHILNFISIPSTEEYHNTFKLKNDKNNVHHFKDIELHTIELIKFEDNKDKQAKNDKEDLVLLLSKIKTSLDRWAAFLSRVDLLVNRKLPKELNDPQIQKALDVLEVMNFSAQEREAYEAHLKWLRDEAGAVENALAKGLKKGLKRGLKEGLKEGRKERDIKIAGNLLSLDIPINVIAKATGLTVQQIKEIKKTKKI